VGNMLGGWGFRFIKKRVRSLLGPNKRKIRKILINLKKSSSDEPLAGMH